MKYLRISNQGELNVEALSLLGASTKRGQTNKIGQFGSGNKFALAYLLRNKYEVTIFSGLKEIKVTTNNKVFREHTFDVICFNDNETSITTEFGKDWQLWQAIRELYCNALDEGEAQIGYVNIITPQENTTNIYIKTRPEIVNFISNFDEVFAENKEVLFSCESGTIYQKVGNSNLNLFRRGIKCFESDTESIFDYDIPNIEIDENRLVKYYWQVPSKIWNIIYSCTDKEIIKTILFNCSKNNLIENISSDFASLDVSKVTDEFKEVLQDLSIAPREMSGLLSDDDLGNTTIIPRAVFDQVKVFVDNNNLPSKFRCYKDMIYTPLEITPLMEATLNKAIEFFDEVGYKSPLNYDIVIARFDNKNILGLANLQTLEIILSEICISKGIQCVIETMIEEAVHLKYEVKDETRGFQDAIITELVEILKIKNAYLV
jgi:hypothetical protein